MSPDNPVLSADTLVHKQERLSSARKLVLLFIFCFAECLDAFNNAALFPAIPALESSVEITESLSVWFMSAFQLTFASFLLISGRISDLYNAKKVLITGLSLLGIISLCAGFANNKIALIVLRALMGIASAMTIPSALTLLVRVFPEPAEQAWAIGVYGGCGAIADVFGFFIGAVLVQYVSYRWVFWGPAIIALLVSLGLLLTIPSEIAKSRDGPDLADAKWKCLDLVGISILTVALILFIYAVTSGSVDGWDTAGVLTPLIVAILLIIGFFHWETRIPIEKAAIPPRTWFYTNFSVLFGSALLPFFWWNTIYLVFTTLWQDVFHWTVISAAVHMFPLGVAALVVSFTVGLSRSISSKWIIIAGLSMAAGATVLLAVRGSRPEHYWPYVFPAFTLGSAGMVLTYTHVNIAILQAAPPSMVGTVGAVFNGALQFGSAVGLAVLCSIETSVEATHGGAQEYNGRAAALLFVLGVLLVEILSVSYFYRRNTGCTIEPGTGDHSSNSAVASSEEKVSVVCDSGALTVASAGSVGQLSRLSRLSESVHGPYKQPQSLQNVKVQTDQQIHG